MPTEFQRIMDITLAAVSNTFSFIADNLVVTHGTEEEHIEKVTEVLQRLDEANNNLNLDIISRQTLNGLDINYHNKASNQ